MRSAERFTVLCSLLLLYTVFSVPLEFLSVFWKRAATRDGTGAPFSSSSASSGSSRKPPTGAAPGLSTNYASQYLGATVVSVEPSSCHGGSALISDNPDKYVLCPCDAPRKQFVVQLIRDVQVHAVMVRNAEHFSSGVRNFTLLGSRRYPTPSWEVLGRFEAAQRRGRQLFDVAPHSHVRYVKLQWATSHGTEPWCTITSFQVFGIDVLETLTRYDDDELVFDDGSAGEASVETATATAATAVEEGSEIDALGIPLLASLSPAEHTREPLTTREGNGSAEGLGAAVPSLDALDGLAAGLWDTPPPSTPASGKGAQAADEVLSPHSVPSGEPAAPASLAMPDLSSGTTEVPSVLSPSAAPATQTGDIPLSSPTVLSVLPWSYCTATLPTMWNASLQCSPNDLHLLWQPCAIAMCGLADPTTSLLFARALHLSDAASSSESGSGSSSVATGSRPASSTVSGSKSIYQNAAASLLTQLLRQQRSLQQNLTSVSTREKHLAHELNRTQTLLRDFYLRYRDTAKEASEYRERLRKMEVELQLLQQQFLLHGQHGSDGGAGGGAAGSGSLLKNDTALAVAAFVLAFLAVSIVFVSSMSPSQRLVGSPRGWGGRQYNTTGSGGVEGSGSGGGERLASPSGQRRHGGRLR